MVPCLLILKRSETKQHTATIFVESLHVKKSGDRLPSWAAAGPGKSCVPPPSLRLSSRPSSWVQRGHAGCRLRRAPCAADEPDASSSSEVNHRYTTSMVCNSSVHTRVAYLMSPKEEKKEKRHIALKYRQKLGCVGMIIKGCLTTPSCLLRVFKNTTIILGLWITWCQYAKKNILSVTFFGGGAEKLVYWIYWTVFNYHKWALYKDMQYFKKQARRVRISVRHTLTPSWRIFFINMLGVFLLEYQISI